MKKKNIATFQIEVYCNNCGGGLDTTVNNNTDIIVVEPCAKCIDKAYQERVLMAKKRKSLAKIICLCGSTRFTREMLIKQWELTKQGFVVLSWCALPDDYYKGEDKTHIGDQENVKKIVDEVHKRKIDIADEILVLNINGYVGSSTRSEIEYAKSQNKLIKYLKKSTSDKGSIVRRIK